MPVRLEMDGDVGVIVLASPERRNALSRDIVGGVLDALHAPAAASARAIVLAGEGPAFCAGADIGDLLGAGWIDGDKDGPDPIDLFAAIGADPRIVIAAVDGMALGGGFELALSCDLAVASQDAVFAVPELGHGVIPNTALWRLSRLVGPRVTMDLAVTGRRMAAQEAAALRLVSAVVPPGTARAAAVAMAAGFIRRAPPGALAALKRGLAAAAPVDWAGVRQALHRIPPAEWREGLTAFAERRQPDYEQFWSDDAHRRAIQDL
jgi:enoyl-CoA hydratase